VALQPRVDLARVLDRKGRKTLNIDAVGDYCWCVPGIEYEARRFRTLCKPEPKGWGRKTRVRSLKAKARCPGQPFGGDDRPWI
jgi:hypothetical protein